MPHLLPVPSRGTDVHRPARRLTACLPLLAMLIVATGGCTPGLTVRAPADGQAQDMVAMREQAAAAYDQEEWAQAAGLLAQITREDSGDAESWFRLGNCEANLNEPARAIRAYGEALRLNPHDARVWHNMGMVQLREATRTFIQLQKHIPPGDPMAERADEIVRGIIDLIGRTAETRNDQ